LILPWRPLRPLRENTSFNQPTANSEVPSFFIFHDNFPFLPLRASAFACPAVATHPLRLRENALCILLARKSPAPLLERGFLKVLILVQG
jgi:hypothetical protein